MTVKKSASIDSLTASIQCASSTMQTAGSVRASAAVLISAVNRRRRASGSMSGSGTSGSAMPSRSSSSSTSCGSASASCSRTRRAASPSRSATPMPARSSRATTWKGMSRAGIRRTSKTPRPRDGRQRCGLTGRPALADARWSHHIHHTTAATDRAVDHGRQPRPSPNTDRLGAPRCRRPACRGSIASSRRAEHGSSSLDRHQLGSPSTAVCSTKCAVDSLSITPPGGATDSIAAQTRPAPRSRRNPIDPEPISPATTRPEFRPTRTADPRRHGVAPQPPSGSSPPGWPAPPGTPGSHDPPTRPAPRTTPSGRHR